MPTPLGPRTVGSNVPNVYSGSVYRTFMQFPIMSLSKTETLNSGTSMSRPLNLARTITWSSTPSTGAGLKKLMFPQGSSWDTFGILHSAVVI